MSGPLRGVIGPAKTRLSNYAVQATALIGGRNPDEHQVRSLMVKITNAINLLEAKNRDWAELIISALGAEKVQLEQEYTTFTTQAGNFLEALDQGREALDDLEIFLTTLTGGPSKSKIRLPLLELPNFDGHLGSWPQFWSAFEAAIDSDKSIPDVQKMSYLISCIKGEAAKEIQGFSVTGPNYPLAIQHLKKRFENIEALKSSLFGQLRKVNCNGRGTQEIRRMTTDISCILGLLKESGEDVNNKATEELIQQKLPAWILLEIIEHKEGVQAWNTDKLIEFLDKNLRQRETVWELTHTNNNNSNGTHSEHNRRDSKSYYGENNTSWRNEIEEE
jgi:hypothetical protein